jgi:ferredoxin
LSSPTATSVIKITVANYSDGDGSPLNIESSPDTTILETLEANQVNVQYHCRDGFCGACRCKLVKGEVKYTTDPLAFIDDDEFLPCCSKALSNLEVIVE